MKKDLQGRFQSCDLKKFSFSRMDVFIMFLPELMRCCGVNVKFCEGCNNISVDVFSKENLRHFSSPFSSPCTFKESANNTSLNYG